MMLRLARPVLLALLGLALAAVPASATDWRLAQPDPPTPPPGVAIPPFAVPLGQVTDISFWGPNRGLMAVDGNDVVPNGAIYKYDGQRWTLVSTVCGGQAKIVWAGADDFWTIANGRKELGDAAGSRRTLCHFRGGAIVASYATPVSAADRYDEMSSGACLTPNDCWFGGAALAAPRVGAFHLRWDGSTLTQVVGPQGREVRGMAAASGQVIEIVDGRDDTAGDIPRLLTPEPDPLMIHRIAAGTTSIVADPFVPPLADSVPPAHTRELYAVRSTGDQVWAAGGPSASNAAPEGVEQARPFVAISSQGGPFSTVALDPARFPTAIRPVGIAPQPGTDRAWMALQYDADPASPTLVELNAAGTILQATRLPETGDPDPGARLAATSAITALACAAPGDCWLGTADGWLFHTASAPAQPADDAFPFTTVLRDRPADAASPRVVSDAAPTDDSGADLGFEDKTIEVPKDETPLTPTTSRVRIKALSRTRVEVRFDVDIEARVRVRAFYRKKVVSRSSWRTVDAGRHRITIKVTPKRWPTRISLDVNPA
jgi:hypothetical protein